MADDQTPKTMDINDLVRELSKSSTSSTTPPSPSPIPKPPMSPPMTSSGPISQAPRQFVPPPVPSPAKPPLPKPEVPRPQFSVPPQPNQPKPAPLPISKPAPAVSSPPPPTPGVKEFQSSIRTMNEDISRIKQGQKPTGVDIPRKVEQVVPVAPQPMPPKPVAPGSQFKVPSVNLGEAKKTGPLAQSKDIPKPPVSPRLESKPQIYIPESKPNGGSRNMLFLGIGAVAIVAGFSYWFFVLKPSVSEVVVETPTPTPVATPTFSPLEKLGITEKVSVPSTSIFLTTLTTEMNNRRPSTGQIKLYDIVDENQQKYSFREFLTKLSVDTSTLNDAGILDAKEWVLGLYGQIGAGQDTSARPFIVITHKNSALVTSLMNTWEERIINDLAKLLSLNNVPSNPSFSSDVYSNTSFRFIRIPNKDLGVAFAILQGYLVIGSSRDSFRAVLDVLTTY